MLLASMYLDYKLKETLLVFQLLFDAFQAAVQAIEMQVSASFHSKNPIFLLFMMWQLKSTN